MAMPPRGYQDVPPPVGGVSHKLSCEGSFWAHASVNADGANASFCCAMPNDAWSFLTRVSVSLQTARKVTYTVYANGSNVPSASNRTVVESTLGGAEQKLALVDAGGKPWAELRIKDELRLFDLKGRERARIGCDFHLSGRRLNLRCWDDAGKELSGEEFLMA